MRPARLFALATILLTGFSNAAELPASFPADVALAEYMQVVGVTEVGKDMMVDLHAPDKTVADVVSWFKAGLGDAGWTLNGELVTPSKAILPFSKGPRRCGISITDFVLDGSMQMDKTIKGITVQISGPREMREAAEESSSSAEDAAIVAE